MTVSYQYEVASSTSGGFTRLLFMWRGSLYKLIYRELLLFLLAFGLLSALYRNAFTPEQKRLFEKVVIYCDTFINLIPLSFVLGFYVAYVAGRWWQQFMAIPWPDKVMHSMALYVGSSDEQGRILRRTLMRYLNLSLILVLRSISSAVKRRFPTMDHLIEAGFMTRIELEMFLAVPSLEFNTYWIPCTWFISHLKDARRGGKITDTQGLKLIMQEFNEFRSKCGLLWSYDWISIPLVYTQVVTLATYSFFIAALVGRQYVEGSKKQLQMEIDIYLPAFTILQFFFFMGLLKVAEQLINPFGDDDEDFELNWLIDRHTKVSYLGVDILMAKTPPLVKDKYFDDVNLVLPYTGAAVAYKKKTYRGSVHNMMVPEDQQSMFLPDITEEEETNSIHQNSIPKTSFSNLFTNASTGSESAEKSLLNIQINSVTLKSKPSANLNCLKPERKNLGRRGLRQSVGSTDIKWVADSDETGTSLQEQHGSKIKNFFIKGPRLPTPIVRDKPFNFNIPEKQQWEHWSSNSTIDSYCSTTNAFNDSVLEIPEVEESVLDNEESGKKRSKRKRTESEPSATLTTENLISNLGIHRQSTCSGQWKGIRWKPMLNDSEDKWSNKYTRIKGYNSAEEIQQSFTNYHIKVDEKRQNVDPLLAKKDQIKKRTAHAGYISISNSLPNLHLCKTDNPSHKNINM